jgi:hypothetical protein
MAREKNPASAATTSSQYHLFGGPCGMTLPPEVLHDQRLALRELELHPPVKLRIWHSIAAGPCFSERADFD